MKKIYLIILFTSLFQNVQAIVIQDIVVTNLNANDLNIHTKVGDGYYFEFFNHNYNIINNTIILNICYAPYLTPVFTFKENDFVISDINIAANNFVLIVNIYKRMYVNSIWVCDSLIDTDTETLNFSTPLDGVVTLLSNNFIEDNNQIVLYPNPTTGILHFSNKFNINKIEIFDQQCRKVKILDAIFTDFISVSDLENGIYYIAYDIEGVRFTKKIVLKK